MAKEYDDLLEKESRNKTAGINNDRLTPAATIQLSIAISMKRIADALEARNEPIIVERIEP